MQLINIHLHAHSFIHCFRTFLPDAERHLTVFDLRDKMVQCQSFFCVILQIWTLCPPTFSDCLQNPPSSLPSSFFWSEIELDSAPSCTTAQISPALLQCLLHILVACQNCVLESLRADWARPVKRTLSHRNWPNHLRQQRFRNDNPMNCRR